MSCGDLTRPRFCPNFALKMSPIMPGLHKIRRHLILYKQPVIRRAMMDIDTTGFEHGMPSKIEMLEHQCHLLSGENDVLRRELALAQANINKLVSINQGLNSQITAEFLRANGSHVRLVQIGNRLRCCHGIDITHWFSD